MTEINCFLKSCSLFLKMKVVPESPLFLTVKIVTKKKKRRTIDTKKSWNLIYLTKHKYSTNTTAYIDIIVVCP